MKREDATKLARELLNKYELNNWKVRLNTNQFSGYLGLCSHKDKCIILNAHHVNTHPDAEIDNTIRHEVAHALTRGHGHDSVWSDKAREIGCTNTLPCATYALSEEAIDAIRSGATLEIEFDEHVVRTPRYKISQLQDVCEECGKIAKEWFTIEEKDKDKNLIKMIVLECGHMRRKVIPRGTPFDEFVTNDWKPEVKNCKHNFNKNQCLECGEFRLYEFQVEGCRAIEKGLAVARGFGLFDDPGLGKTMQAMVYMRYHPERFPFLGVVKSSLKYQFWSEIMRVFGPEYFPQMIMKGTDPIFPGLKSYIVGYDMLRRMDVSTIEKLGIKTIILDECQQIKNVDSTRTQMVRRLAKIEDVKILPLSGTPWKNRGSELFPVYNMLNPIKFHSNKYFVDRWVDFYYQGDKRKEAGIRNPKAFREYVKDICIRRERTEVMKELPLINRTKLKVQLEGLAAVTYDESVSEFVKWYNDYITEDKEVNGMELVSKMQRMRHIVGLNKIPATIAFTEEFLEDTDRKLVIFAHHKDVQTILTDECKKLGTEWKVPVYQFHAGLNSLERANIQDSFNRDTRALMVASTLAAGEGLNLQTCCDCILHERQWNPGNEEQAEGRFIRIGQASTSVNGTYVEAENTVDIDMDFIIERKRRQFHELMNKGQMPAWSEAALAKEVAERIVDRWNNDKKRRRA